MEKAMNTLPIKTYERTRVSSTVHNIGGLSSGSVSFTLDKPSDVNLQLLSDPAEYVPGYFVAAINRTPTMDDFDIVLAPVQPYNLKPSYQNLLRLPAGNYTLNWATFSVSGSVEAFGSLTLTRLLVAIDA